MTKMRQDFEAAYQQRFKGLRMNWSERAGRYLDAHAAGAWWAWQTATPKAFGDGWCAAKGLERPESMDRGHTDD